MAENTKKVDLATTQWGQRGWRVEGTCSIHDREGGWVGAAAPHRTTDGIMAKRARAIALSSVLPDLYASEINASISWFWDGGFDVSLGDELNGFVARSNFDDWEDALEWLSLTACSNWPESDFAKAREVAA